MMEGKPTTAPKNRWGLVTMAFRVRSSKYRHIFGNPSRKELCYENVRITKNAHDSNFCAVNPKFMAVVTEASGGGAFLVLPLEKTGRVDINAPRVTGHAGTVLDIKWNPFDDNVIASAADDNTVKTWRIPDHGLHSNLTEWLVDLHGHQRKVTNIEWHPTASNIILSAGMDHKCFLWNIERAEPINVMSCHTDTVFSISWNRDGSNFVTTSKDKKIRVVDPRGARIAVEGSGHQGVKASKSVFLADTNRIFTTGFSKLSERQYAIWDVRNMSRSMRMEVVDFSSGILFPFYDHDTKVIFLAGKGDGNIRYYELVGEAPYCHYLNQYQSSSPQRSLGFMPKRGCDAKRCEIVRFYKLHTAKDIVEPISMIVPRKSEQFQVDIFPATASCVPSLSADEWVSGQNRDPILISLQDGTLNQAPTITTFKAVNRPPLARACTLPTAQVPPSVNTEIINKEPASLKNIKRLSSNDEFVTLSSDPTNNMCNPDPSTDTDTFTTAESVHKPTEKVLRKSWVTSTNPNTSDEISSNGHLSSTPGDRIHVKKVWSQNINTSPGVGNGTHHTDIELRKAYFQQVEEIKSLKEQVSVKDKRIRQLEEEVSSLRQHRITGEGGSTAGEESNC